MKAIKVTKIRAKYQVISKFFWLKAPENPILIFEKCVITCECVNVYKTCVNDPFLFLFYSNHHFPDAPAMRKKCEKIMSMSYYPS